MKISRLVLGALAVAASALPAGAQEWPNKPVSIQILSATGGVMNTIARIVTDPLSAKWKQPVILENKPGAGGFIASDYVRRAPPDGHTLLMGSDAMSTFRLFIKGNDFDPGKDLIPISTLTYTDFVIFTNDKVPAKTIEQFISHAKSNPGKLNYATIGRNQQTLDTIRFSRTVGIDMEAVSYGGSNTAIPAMLANDVQFYVTTYATGGQHARAGTFVPLAAMGEKRVKEMPDVPTLKERGIDVIAGSWFGWFAPPGTPRAIVDKISADTREVLSRPEVAEPLEKLGYTLIPSTPEQMTARIAAEMKLRADVARAANIQPE